MSKWHDDAVAFGATHIYCDDSSSATPDTLGSLDMTTLGTAPTLTDGPRGRPAWHWDGDGSLYHAPNAGYPQDDTFSLETWVRFDEDAAFQTASMIRSSTDYEIGGHSFGAGAYEVLGGGSSVDGQHVLRQGARSYLGQTGLGDMRWHQVVATITGDLTATIYADGRHVASVPLALPADGSAGFRIAANGYVPGDETQRWTGDISSVAIYDRVLTAHEVWILWGLRPRTSVGILVARA